MSDLLLHEDDYKAMTWRQRLQLRRMVRVYRTRDECVKRGRALLFSEPRWLYLPADPTKLFAAIGEG